MKYKLLLLVILLIGCSKDNIMDDVILNENPIEQEPQSKYNFPQTFRNYNQPHHIVRNSILSSINTHDVMLSLGRDMDNAKVGPDNMGAAFADWNGDGYEDFIASVSVTDCWTCRGLPPELYLYDSEKKDFYYEEMKFTHSENEVVNSNGIKIYGDFDGDGDPDLLFGGYEDWNTGKVDKVWMLENNYSVDGTFIPHDMSMFIQKNETASVDIDNDGDLDIFVVQLNDLNYTHKPVFLINQGNFNFTVDDTYFEMLGDDVPWLQHLFYQPTENNSTIFEDLNNDGYVDILWHTPLDYFCNCEEQEQAKDIVKRKNKIIWGSENKYSINDVTTIPSVDGYMLITSMQPWDYNNDGKKEIVIIRNKANGINDTPGEFGFYIQLLKLNEKEFIDKTGIIEFNTELNYDDIYSSRLFDFDGDGYSSLVNLRVTYDLHKRVYRWEWDGSKIKFYNSFD